MNIYIYNYIYYTILAGSTSAAVLPLKPAAFHQLMNATTGFKHTTQILAYCVHLVKQVSYY